MKRNENQTDSFLINYRNLLISNYSNYQKHYGYTNLY